MRAPARIAPQAGFIRGDEFFVIKMAPGCFSGNAKLQPPLPGNTGVMVVFSQRTGMLRGVLLDEGYLTELRTAAAGALAAKCVLPSHACGLHMPGTKLTRVSYARVRPIAPTHETSLPPPRFTQQAPGTSERDLHWHPREWCAGPIPAGAASWRDEVPACDGVGQDQGEPAQVSRRARGNPLVPPSLSRRLHCTNGRASML